MLSFFLGSYMSVSFHLFFICIRSSWRGRAISLSCLCNIVCDNLYSNSNSRLTYMRLGERTSQDPAVSVSAETLST